MTIRKICYLCGVKPVESAGYNKDKQCFRKTCSSCRIKSKTSQRKSDLKKNYGITLEEYDKMFASQGGVCKLCSKPQHGRVKNLCVDHCHKTGKIRGLLCSNCNRALGLFKDDSNVLSKASSYVLNI